MSRISLQELISGAAGSLCENLSSQLQGKPTPPALGACTEHSSTTSAPLRASAPAELPASPFSHLMHPELCFDSLETSLCLYLNTSQTTPKAHRLKWPQIHTVCED